jgi:hypothetical protein
MIFCVSAVILTAMLATMAKWGFDMINREEHKRLLEEVERLKAENKELREFVDKFQRKTAGIYE